MFRGGSYADLGSTACSRKLRSSTTMRDCHGVIVESRSPTPGSILRLLQTYRSPVSIPWETLIIVFNSSFLVSLRRCLVRLLRCQSWKFHC